MTFNKKLALAFEDELGDHEWDDLFDKVIALTNDLTAENKQLREALRAAYPVLHYYGHPIGEQHINASPSRRSAEEALLLVRAIL